MDTWNLDRVDNAGFKYYTRNPYYFKVDTAGNQLPYVDELVRVLVENREVRTLKIVSGEFDYVGWDLPLKEYTLYKENEAQNDYRVMVWPQAVAARTAYEFNYGAEDEVLRAIFEDLRFRQAMSLAIDREEIIKVLAFGRAEPMQAAAFAQYLVLPCPGPPSTSRSTTPTAPTRCSTIWAWRGMTRNACGCVPTASRCRSPSRRCIRCSWTTRSWSRSTGRRSAYRSR